MTTPAIQTERLSKSFGHKAAVQDLSLTVERGEVFGFLGPNGAGKTTSVKMLLGLVFPSGGQGRLFGRPLHDPEARRRVGFLPEHFRFPEWLQAGEFMQLHARLYGLAQADARRRIPELLERVNLSEHTHKKLGEYSKGMLQRIGLAQALLNQPELVILDEPTSGLDPIGRRLVRDIIKDLSQQGCAVFLNSHLLSEVEITCHRVTFIKYGQVIRTSRLQDLVEAAVTVHIRQRGLPAEALPGLSQWASDVRLDGEHLSLVTASEAALPQVNRYLVEHGAEVFALTPQRLALEDLFIQIVGTDGGL